MLVIAKETGLLKLAHVSVDGNKLAANASIYQTVSYEQLQKKEENLSKHVDELRKQVQAMLEKADQIDAEEDALYGKERGDELPKALRTKEGRLAKIKESLKAMKEAGMDVAAASEQKTDQEPKSNDAEKPSSKTKKEKRKIGALNFTQLIAYSLLPTA